MRTNDDLHEAILGVKGDVINVRTEVLGLRGDFNGLREHVNDEVELLRDRIDRQDTKIDGKLDNDDLLTSLGFKLLNNRWARWVAGLAVTSVVATAIRSEWYPWIVRFLQLVQQFLT